MQYNKLVRDNIPEIIKSKGANPIIHIADDKEFEVSLRNKVQEEVNEFLENICVEEAADILEVIQALCDFKKIDLSNLEDVRNKKAEERGAFKKRIILERTEE